MKTIKQLEKIRKETKKAYKGKWNKSNESKTLLKYLHLKGINTKLETLKEVLLLIEKLELRKRSLGGKDGRMYYVLYKDIEKLKEKIEGSSL